MYSIRIDAWHEQNASSGLAPLDVEGLVGPSHLLDSIERRDGGVRL